MKKSYSWILPLIVLSLAACAPPPAAAPPPAPAISHAQAEWDRVIDAAKREGKVSVIIPSGVEVRAALVEPFQERFGIIVDAWGARGSEIPPRVETERAAGQ